MTASGLFGDDFQLATKTLVNVHHSIYPQVPPQGIYFEALVEEAFRKIKKPFTPIEPTNRNQPIHDLGVEGARISLKTETGKGTKLNHITITKLCTTEKDPWDARTLVSRAIAHLERYDVILMLRAVWNLPVLHYQLVEIPVELLRLMEIADLQVVGHRSGARKSLAADVFVDDQRVFRVHFDGSDGKCTIRNLPVVECDLLIQWDVQVR